MKFKKFNKIKRINFKRKKCFNTINYRFKFGDKALFTFNQLRIEKIHLKIIKKIIKKKFRKKRKKLKIHNKFWIRYNQNLLLTKKSKNARMGSGRGKYFRSAFVLKKNQSFLEFKNFDYHYLSLLKKKIHFKLNINLILLIKNFTLLKIS